MSQTVLDNVRTLRKAVAGRLDDIDRIRIGMAQLHWDERVRRAVNDIHSANFSPSFAAVIGLLHDVPPLYESPISAELWKTAFRDAEVQRLLTRTEEVVDDEIERHNPYSVDTTIELVLRDGRLLRQGTQYEFDVPTIGTRRLRPVSPDQIRAKFGNLTVASIGDTRVRQILEMVDGLDRLDDVRQLAAAVA